jgi:hypothetical protein
MAEKSIEDIIASVSDTQRRLEAQEKEKTEGSRTVDKQLKELNTDLESLSFRSKLVKGRPQR